MNRVEGEWLSEHGASGVLQEFLGVGAHRISSNEDHTSRHASPALEDSAPDGTAVNVRQSQIEGNDVIVLPLDPRNSLMTGRSLLHPVARPAEDVTEDSAKLLLVVDNQDAGSLNGRRDLRCGGSGHVDTEA